MKLNLFSLIFLSVGLLLAGIAGYLVYSTNSEMKTFTRVKGIVIELNTSRGRRGSITSAPVVEYVTTDGRIEHYASGTYTSPPSFELNETVEILYNPKNPKDAMIDSFGQLWLAPMIVGGLGIFFFGFGALFSFVKT
jgi:hypothetical protein